MKKALFVLLLASAIAPALVSACGGCMPLEVPQLRVTDVSMYQHIFLGKVIDLQIIKRPDYKQKAAEARKFMAHGYGSGKTEIPEFDTKLKVQLTKQYKGKQTTETVEILVTPDFNTNTCNYFHYAKDQSYYFFIAGEKLQTTYYDPVFHANSKDYTEDERGWLTTEDVEKIHKQMVQTLEMVLTAKDGEAQKFSSWDGQLYAEGALSAGLPQGQWTFYHPVFEENAKIQKSEVGNYNKGLRVGEWLHYTPEGTVDARVVYEKDEKNGRIAHYYNELLTTEENLKNGELHGKQTYYHWNSKNINYTQTYANGVLEGEYLAYNENGEVVLKGGYKNNHPVGTWETTNPDGKKTIENYDNDGNLVAAKTKKTK